MLTVHRKRKKMEENQVVEKQQAVIQVTNVIVFATLKLILFNNKAKGHI